MQNCKTECYKSMVQRELVLWIATAAQPAGRLDVEEVYAINAALVDGVRDLNAFSASLRDLALVDGSNVATVSEKAEQIPNLSGSIADVVQVKTLSTLIPFELHEYDCLVYAEILEPACTGALPSDRQRRADL